MGRQGRGSQTVGVGEAVAGIADPEVRDGGSFGWHLYAQCSASPSNQRKGKKEGGWWQIFKAVECH